MTKHSIDLAPPAAAPADAPAEPRPSPSSGAMLRFAERFGLLGILVIEIVIFSILRPDTFATVGNFRVITSSIAVLTVAGLGLLIPLIGGRFDVSVGANIGVCAIVSATTMSRLHLPLLLAIVFAMIAGAFFGAVNGALVAYLGVNSIIATIGMSTVMGGLVSAYTGGIPIQSGLSKTLLDMGTLNVLGVPRLFVVTVIVALATWYVLTQVPYGRRLEATGTNLNAATLNGFAVRPIVFGSFAAAGLLAGLAGVMQVATQGSGDPTVGGLNFVLSPLAACFLSATTIKPGRYNVIGMFLGLVFISTTISGLVLLGLKPWVSDVFNGAAVVVAIALSAQIKRRRTGSMTMGT